MIKGVDFHWFPLDNPGIVAIPLSFLLGVVGTWIGRRPADERVEDALHAAMEVRALTGAGAEPLTPPLRRVSISVTASPRSQHGESPHR